MGFGDNQSPGPSPVGQQQTAGQLLGQHGVVGDQHGQRGEVAPGALKGRNWEGNPGESRDRRIRWPIRIRTHPDAESVLVAQQKVVGDALGVPLRVLRHADTQCQTPSKATENAEIRKSNPLGPLGTFPDLLLLPDTLSTKWPGGMWRRWLITSSLQKRKPLSLSEFSGLFRPFRGSAEVGQPLQLFRHCLSNRKDPLLSVGRGVRTSKY